jgi:serine/threonine protein kinase
MLTVGSQVCGYRIQRLLGSGGMGAVYLAADPDLPRHIALKVLSAELSRDPDFRARFVREADTAAALEHPQIVSVYNRGQTDEGQLWIAMQFVDGTDADAALRAGTMSPQRAVHIITEVAKAVDFAHAHHVVHRDIKPGNFLLSGPVGANERVLLGDFGIARALDDVGLTVTGSVMATLAYAAPEVLSEGGIDGRVDLYSLGCTLYRLLTGQTPYPGDKGAAATMAAHLFSPPPRVTDVVPSLPAAMDQVIAVAMAKDPSARFPSAAALAAAAASALYDPTRLLPLPPVPSGEVSSYPRTDSPPAPWWQPSGSRTALPAGPPWSPPTRRRRRGVVIGAGVATVVLLAATVTIVAWPDSTATTGPGSGPGSGSGSAGSRTVAQGPPATNISGPQLRSILLTGDEITSTTHGDVVVLETDTTTLPDDTATVDNPQCLGAWAPAQQSVYASTSYRAAVVQTLRAMNQSEIQDGVTQAVVAVPTQNTAGKSYAKQRGQWALCGGKAITVTAPGQPAQSWDFGQPVTTAGVMVLTATLGGGATSCQHGLLERGNVVIDIRQCRASGSFDVASLLNATAAKVPRQ